MFQKNLVVWKLSHLAFPNILPTCFRRTQQCGNAISSHIPHHLLLCFRRTQQCGNEEVVLGMDMKAIGFRRTQQCGNPLYSFKIIPKLTACFRRTQQCGNLGGVGQDGRFCEQFQKNLVVWKRGTDRAIRTYRRGCFRRTQQCGNRVAGFADFR